MEERIRFVLLSKYGELSTLILFQTKFHSSRRPSDPCSTPPQQPSHGVCVQANPIVVLNALGYIGFKVVSTCGDAEVINFLCSPTLLGRYHSSGAV